MCMYTCTYRYLHVCTMWIPLAPGLSQPVCPVASPGPLFMGPGHARSEPSHPAAGTDHLSYTELARALLAPQWATLHCRRSISKLERFQKRPLIWQALEYLPCEERLEELGSARLEQRWVWRNLTTAPRNH